MNKFNTGRNINHWTFEDRHENWFQILYITYTLDLQLFKDRFHKYKSKRNGTITSGCKGIHQFFLILFIDCTYTLLNEKNKIKFIYY